MPKASAQPEYMSSASPGARPKPVQRVMSPWFMVHANPLCLFFWMDASLTIVSVEGLPQRLWRYCVGWCHRIGPNMGRCQGSSCSRNCATKVGYAGINFEGFKLGSGGIGSRICRCLES